MASFSDVTGQSLSQINQIANAAAIAADNAAINAANEQAAEAGIDEAIEQLVPEENANAAVQEDNDVENEPLTQGDSVETMSTLRSSMFGSIDRTPLEILKQYIKDFYSGDYGASLSISITSEDITSYFGKLYENIQNAKTVTSDNINEFSKLFSIERKAQHISKRIGSIEEAGTKRNAEQASEKEQTTKDEAITLLSDLTSFIEKSINTPGVDIVADSIFTILNPIILILKNKDKSERIVKSNDADLNSKLRILNGYLTEDSRNMTKIKEQIELVVAHMNTIIEKQGGSSKRKTKKHHKKSKKHHKSKKSKSNKKSKHSKRKH